MAEPSFDDDYRCAPWTLRQGIDPIGSATRFDTFLTVEIPGPWPRDAGDHPLLAGIDAPKTTRIQAVGIDGARDDGAVLVTRWTRPASVDPLAVDANLIGTDWLVPAADVRPVLEALAAGSTELDDAGDPAPDELFICSHGARDRCCGGSGTRLAAEARPALGGLRVRRTSHLGGHRYAPTAVSFPDGRLWAFLDIDILRGIVDRSAHPDEAREFYRGNSALDPWAQVLEAQLLVDGGWGAVDFDELAASTHISDDGRSATVDLIYTARGATDRAKGTVEIGETYPVIVCGLPPEEAEKTAVTYRLR